VLEAFSEADLVVLSSISEGFPYSTLEAMLCRKPIVATSVGGIAEQVTPDCGRLVRPRDPQALGAAILDVLSSPENCLALAGAARERAASLFTLDRFQSTHREIYAMVTPARNGRLEDAAEAETFAGEGRILERGAKHKSADVEPSIARTALSA
jgi:glycosyltransferase involved in cell wall biosynthesis